MYRKQVPHWAENSFNMWCEENGLEVKYSYEDESLVQKFMKEEYDYNDNDY
jgi:hypothetical protein